VADAQRDVMERASIYTLDATERLLGDFSRLITQLGNLDEASRRHLTSEVVRLCTQSELELTVGPEVRQIIRRRTKTERRAILAELKHAHRLLSSPKPGNEESSAWLQLRN
jgi:hypothetical protein